MTAAKESAIDPRESCERVRVSRLGLYLLGPPRVELDGEPVHIGRSKAMALLAYLAVEPRRHSRDALATLLWPEYSQRDARADLRRTLSFLNCKLGRDWLTADRESVGLRQAQPESPGHILWLDVDAFRQRLAASEAHGHPAAESCPDCQARLTEAVELYRDDFLSGFTLPDAPAFDEWQRFQTQGLRDELGSALERLAACHGAGGTYEAAIACAQRWLALDPLRESAHRQLMELYAQAGRRSAALRQYQECVRILEGELGVPPSAEITALHERIQAQRVGREAPRAPPMENEAVAPPPLHNLPPQPTLFIGREEELAHIARRLEDPACRLLTLVGTGGVGKTRLALAAAERQLSAEGQPKHGQSNPFPNGVFFVPLAPMSGPELLVPAIASALNLAFYSGGDAQEQLLAYLREKRLLLLLDNFEHLLVSPPSVRSAPLRDAAAVPPMGGEERGAVAGEAISSPPAGGIEGGTEGGIGLVAAILQAAPAVKMLVTSREALNLQGEWFHPVDGMRYPVGDAASDAEADASLRDYDALALFAQSARRARPGFDLAQKRQPVARICQLVEGIPLAIEMAAAWLKALSPRQIVQELERGLDILSSSLRGVPARHRSMRAVFDHSWNLLSAPERAVMQALSVFRGGFEADAAQAVAGARLPTLVGLVEKSLLRRTPEGRYQVHELLRQYAAEKLHADRGEEERVRDRHGEFFATFLQARGDALKGRAQRSALREIQGEFDNARVAWNWAVERGQVVRLDRAMEGFFLFCAWRGHYREGEAACRRAAERLGETDSGDALRVLARLMTWQSVFSEYLGHYTVVCAQAEQSLGLLDRLALAEHDTRPERAFALWQLGDTFWSGDPELDRRTLEQSLGLYRELGDRWGTANALHSLGLRAWHDGAIASARQAYTESLALRRALGDLKGVADTLFELSTVFWGQGHLGQAERLARESIDIQSETDEPIGLPGGLCNLGFVLMLRGQFVEAQGAFEESAAIANDLGAIPVYAFYTSMQGTAQMHLGRYETALARVQMAMNAVPKGVWWGYEVVAQTLLGELALVEESYVEAQRLLQDSSAILREMGQQYDLGRLLAILVYADRGLGQLRQARQHLAAALRILTEMQHFRVGLLALPAAALLLADAGEGESALELYAPASRYPFVANSRWFEDVAGRHLAAVAETLPRDVVAAAQERGRARDLWATAAELLAELEGT